MCVCCSAHRLLWNHDDDSNWESIIATNDGDIVLNSRLKQRA